MASLIHSMLQEWIALPSQRHKLQYAYLISAVIAVAIAGVLTYFRSDLASFFAGIGILFIATFLLNAVAWALLQAFIEPYAKRLSKPTYKRK